MLKKHRRVYTPPCDCSVIIVITIRGISPSWCVISRLNIVQEENSCCRLLLLCFILYVPSVVLSRPLLFCVLHTVCVYVCVCVPLCVRAWHRDPCQTGNSDKAAILFTLSERLHTTQHNTHAQHYSRVVECNVSATDRWRQGVSQGWEKERQNGRRENGEELHGGVCVGGEGAEIEESNDCV